MTLEDIIENDNMKKYERYVWLSDTHCPFQDNKTLKACYNFLEDANPNKIILGGDMIDCWNISRFDKNPTRLGTFQKEVDSTYSILSKIRDKSPSSEIIYLEANHENRVIKELVKRPQFYGLRALEIPALLSFDELGIEYKPYHIHKEFLFKHGDYTNKYHANKELEIEGMSVMMGHNHRNQVISKTNRLGTITGYSVGHLSDNTKIDYAQNKTMNWQQGFAVIDFKKGSSKWHQVNLIPITKNRFIVDGVVYEG